MDAADNLASKGYCKWSSKEFAKCVPGLKCDRFNSLLVSEVQSLELQEQTTLKSGRKRKHHKMFLLHDRNELVWFQPNDGKSIYYQGQYNTEHTEPREFDAFSRELLECATLRDLILFNFSLTRWGNDALQYPLCVGLSLIQFFVSEEDEPSQFVGATPNHFHQDGEVYTFAHLIDATNSIGGINYIAPPELAQTKCEDADPRNILSEFRLFDFFDSYAIHDPSVSHHVTPVRKQNPSQDATRTIFLIDFTPMRLIHHI